MSVATWLFLYLAGLVELAIRYRLSMGGGIATWVVLIPVFVLALPRPQWRSLQWLGALLAFGCAIFFSRALSLDFWDPTRLDLAWLAAGVGVGGLFATQQGNPRADGQMANWILVSLGWLLALWNPAAPWLAIAPAAALALCQPNEPPVTRPAGLSPAWLLFWVGMAVPKPWWDSDAADALPTALWALAVAISYAPRLRGLRLPLPLLTLALFPLAYPWMPNWLWAPLLGLLSGWGLQQTSAPWHRTAAYALLGGLLLSYGLHSNLQWFGLLVWGSL